MVLSDNDLVLQAATGDERALARLLEEHGPAVRAGMAGRIPRRWQAALSIEDVMQQTYIDAFADLDRFVPNGPGSFAAWLNSLARCNLRDAVKMFETDKRGKGHHRLEPRTPEESFVDLCELVGATDSTPSRKVARAEACTALRWALQQLPESYRRVVQRYDLDACPVEEVARELNRRPGAVYMIRARAHRRLREIMGRASHYLSTD